MSEGRDETSGEYRTKYDPEEFIEAIRQQDGLAGTTDVAQYVGVPQRTAYDYLARLNEDGRISIRSIGGRNVWLLADSEVEA